MRDVVTPALRANTWETLLRETQIGGLSIQGIEHYSTLDGQSASLSKALQRLLFKTQNVDPSCTQPVQTWIHSALCVSNLNKSSTYRRRLALPAPGVSKPGLGKSMY